MSKKIENLTNEDVAQFDVYVNKWLDIGLSTAPADFESAKEAVCRAYVVAGLKAPSKFYTAQSPIDAIKKWPGAIGYVPQDVLISNGTIRQNVCFVK